MVRSDSRPPIALRAGDRGTTLLAFGRAVLDHFLWCVAVAKPPQHTIVIEYTTLPQALAEPKIRHRATRVISTSYAIALRTTRVRLSCMWQSGSGRSTLRPYVAVFGSYADRHHHLIVNAMLSQALAQPKTYHRVTTLLTLSRAKMPLHELEP